jgi:hypothetical protein
LLAKLKDPAATNLFGWAVAVSGTTAVVGAPAEPGTGAAYIYEKGASGWPVTPSTTLSEPGGTSDYEFGSSVAVSGTTVVVGAPGTSSSAEAAYIYVKGASGWPTTPTVTLTDPLATVHDDFGDSVAVTGKTVVVGAQGTDSFAGTAYIYVNSGSGWPITPTTTLSDPTATSGDNFGGSVAVSGKTAVVGAYGSSSYAGGAAYIYVKGASGWPTIPTTELLDPAFTTGDNFGGSVGVWNGTVVVVAAQGTNSFTGTAYIYVRSASGWPTTPTTTLSDPRGTADDVFGWSLAVQGTNVIVGAPGTNSGAGTAYIYVNRGSGWPTEPTTTLSHSKIGNFGASVAVSGKTAVVCRPGDAAYIYKA